MSNSATVHEWETVTFSWGGYIQCSCGYRPASQGDMDMHMPQPVNSGPES